MERDDMTRESVSSSAGSWRQTTAERAALPPPPALHWGWVFLFSVLTFGLFTLIWPFVQANWVRKIDPQSSAKSLLWVALACSILGYVLTGTETSHEIGAPMSTQMRLGMLLQLVHVVLYLIAYFAMAASIRREMAAYRVPVRIGAITLFFLNLLYLQGQLRWLAHWQQTGRTQPQPPKAVLWVCFVIPAVVIMAALALPAYQIYVVRAQVAGALAQAEPLKQQVIDAIGLHRAWPQSNTQAGLKEAEAYAGNNLSGFVVYAVDDGTALVTRFDEHALVPLRGKQLAWVAGAQGGAIVWHCESPDIEAIYLPESCH